MAPTMQNSHPKLMIHNSGRQNQILADLPASKVELNTSPYANQGNRVNKPLTRLYYYESLV